LKAVVEVCSRLHSQERADPPVLAENVHKYRNSNGWIGEDLAGAEECVPGLGVVDPGDFSESLEKSEILELKKRGITYNISQFFRAFDIN
jgi:hypothetical protein